MEKWLKRGILGIAVLALSLPAPSAEAAEGWKKIAAPALAEMITRGKDPLLINTMSLLECLDHSIAGSVCIAGEEFAGRIGELPPQKERPLVLYCESETGTRSCEAADVAVRHGYRAVHVLDGGLPAWKEAGYGTVSTERIPRRAIPSIKPPVLQKRLIQKHDLLLVDIRSESLFQKEHIAGAVNLPLHQLHSRWRELPLDRQLILVDNRGFRSHLAASYLEARGYAVEPLYGGITAWRAMVAKELKKTAGK